MAYAAVLEAREIGKRDMDMVREAIKLREDRARAAEDRANAATAKQLATIDPKNVKG